MISLFSKSSNLKAPLDNAMSNSLNQLASGSIEFIFVAVDGSSPNEVAQRLGSVADMAIQSGWDVLTFVSNVVVLMTGHLKEANQATDRAALSKLLHDELSAKIKVIHGSENANYGVLLPSFLGIAESLNKLSYGECREFIR